MRLEFRVRNRWAHVAHFMAEDTEDTKRAAAELARLSERAGDPLEARIVDAMGVAVLKMITPLGWVVPKGLEGYTWVT